MFYLLCHSHHTGTLKVDGDIQLEQLTPALCYSPVFKLTCVTTGGPATTVLWKKNMMTVNNSNTAHVTTTLIDRVEATYLHTLTVMTSNLTGFYQIAIQNSNSRVTSNINITSKFI